MTNRSLVYEDVNIFVNGSLVNTGLKSDSITVEAPDVLGDIITAKGINIGFNKSSDIDNIYNITIPVVAGADADKLFQNFASTRQAFILKIEVKNSDNGYEIYELGVAQVINEPTATISFGVQDADARATRAYNVKGAGKRIVV